MTTKRVELAIVGSDERIQNSQKRCIEEGLLPVQRRGLPIDDGGQMRAKCCMNQITVGAEHEDVPEDKAPVVEHICRRRAFAMSRSTQSWERQQTSCTHNTIPITCFKGSRYTQTCQRLQSNVWRDRRNHVWSAHWTHHAGLIHAHSCKVCT